MGREMGHVEQRIVLAEFVEIDYSDLISVEQKMIRRKITVCGGRRPWRHCRSALLYAAEQFVQRRTR